MLAPGTRLGGLIIDGLIGRGAMGEVYRATQIALKRPVAVKRIADHLVAEPGAIARFAREAQCLARVRSPHVIAVHDFAQVRDEAGQEHCLLVMELVAGGCSLRQVCGRPLDWRLASSVALQVADGLATAAAAGLVHRDIKPDNIMLDRSGTARLVDFGLARAIDSTALTVAGGLMGTPAYMAPEACRGEPADLRSDVYALGCTWFMMLAGRPPFVADNIMAMLRSHVEQPPPALDALVPGLPPALVALIGRCLAKDPAERPAAGELAGALRGLGIPATAPGLLAGAPHAAGERTTALTADTGGGPGGTISGERTTAPTQVVEAATVPTHVVDAATAARQAAAAADGAGGNIAPSRRRWPWPETIVVVLVIAVLLAVVRFGIWPHMRHATTPDHSGAIEAAVVARTWGIAWQRLDDWLARERSDAAYAAGQRLLAAEVAALIDEERFADALATLGERRGQRPWLDGRDLERSVQVADAGHAMRSGRHDDGERAFLALCRRHPKDLALAAALVDAYAAAEQQHRPGYLPALVALAEAHPPAGGPLPKPTAGRLLAAYLADQPFADSAARLRALLVRTHPAAVEQVRPLVDGDDDDDRLHALHLLRDANALRAEEELRHHLRNVVAMSSAYLAARASAAWLEQSIAAADWPARKAAARIPAIADVVALRSRDAHAAVVARVLATGFADELRELITRWLAGTDSALRANAEEMQRVIAAGR